jgi:hypothetical protein
VKGVAISCHGCYRLSLGSQKGIGIVNAAEVIWRVDDGRRKA